MFSRRTSCAKDACEFATINIPPHSLVKRQFAKDFIRQYWDLQPAASSRVNHISRNRPYSNAEYAVNSASSRRGTSDRIVGARGGRRTLHHKQKGTTETLSTCRHHTHREGRISAGP